MRKIDYSKIDCLEYFDYLNLSITEQNSWTQSRNEILKHSSNPNIYPTSIKDLVLADFEQLTKIYLDFIYLEFNKPILITKEIYTTYSSNIASFFVDKSEELDITTCFYCESAYINAYPFGKKRKRQFDLDHFYPKAKCPILALSLYNLIPSCQICNSRVKASKQIDTLYRFRRNSMAVEKENSLQRLSPSSKEYDFEKKATIRILPQKDKEKTWCPTANFSDYDEQYKVSFTTSDPVTKKDIDAFLLEERYNYKNNKKEFLNLLDLKKKYSDSYINLICKTLNKENIRVYPFEIKEAIFHEESDDSNRRLFNKAKKDILSMWDYD